MLMSTIDRIISKVLVVGFALSAAACGEPNTAPGQADAGSCIQNLDFANSTGSPVALTVCPVGVATPEHARLLLAVYNTTGEPLQFRGRFEFFADLHLAVIGPAGDTLDYENMWEPYEVSMDVTTYDLPVGGLVGRVVDLSCEQNDFGMSRNDSCVPLFDFSQSGRYDVTAYLSNVWTCPGNPCPHESTWMGELEAETVLNIRN